VRRFFFFIFRSLPEPNASSRGDDDHNEPLNRDQLVYEYFSKRFDELFHEKCKAESKVINFVTEVCCTKLTGIHQLINFPFLVRIIEKQH
jgi:hypothetical protein